MDVSTQIGNRPGTQDGATDWITFQRNDAEAPDFITEAREGPDFEEGTMKKLLAMAVAASALAMAAPAAAQSWQSINERQANLDARIDAGVRSGDLTRNEAVRLRAEFRDLARLEARYRSSYGLSPAERRDLDMRFDRLSAQIRYERNDWQDRDRYDRSWRPINQRQRMLENRIDRGIRDGRLTRSEAYRLRAEFDDIARLEARYRRGGLSYQERRDLDRRFDRLDGRLTAWLNDRDRRYG
jgi:hypothetical protein